MRQRLFAFFFLVTTLACSLQGAGPRSTQEPPLDHAFHLPCRHFVKTIFISANHDSHSRFPD